MTRNLLSCLARPLPAVLLVFLLSRVWSTSLLQGSLVIGDRLGRAPSRALLGEGGLVPYLASWDAEHYLRIAEKGYPSVLPLAEDGSVAANDWAFLPLFPALLRALSHLTGLDPAISGIAVATLFGGLAAQALYSLLRQRLDHRQSLWAVVLFCFGPFGFLLQAVYAESLFAFLAFSCLVLLGRRRYLTMIPFGMAAAFSRPGALALALGLGIHVVLRLHADGRLRVTPRIPSSRPRSDIRWLFRAIPSGLAIAAAGLGWPVVAALMTGRPDAYLQTEMAWWRPWVGDAEVLPLTPWFRVLTPRFGIVGTLSVLLCMLSAAWFLTRRSTVRLGSDIVGYCASYTLYLFALFLPHFSIFRLAVPPLSPLLGSGMLVGTKARRVGALGVCLVLQPVAIVALWWTYAP